jgi:hypothetical protein
MNATVYMQHGQEDDAVPFETARITARLLPNCTLDVRQGNRSMSSCLRESVPDTPYSTRLLAALSECQPLRSALVSGD